MVLADTHVHLLGGLDDGPADGVEALAMARTLVAEGVRHATALAHQNDGYPENTAERLRSAATEFSALLKQQNVPLSVYPTGEVMLSPSTLADYQAGTLLSVGDKKRHLLVEMPHGMFLDIRHLAMQFGQLGVRLVIAHAERYPELLYDDGHTLDAVAAGCLIQVTTESLGAPGSAREERALKNWAKRGLIHVIGSDGHNLDRRPPHLRAGVERLAKWAGPMAANRAASIWGSSLLQGGPVNPPPPLPRQRSWFARLLGG